VEAPVAAVEETALASGFSGVVRVDAEGDVVLERAYGLAHRGLGVRYDVRTRFGIASGGKGLTALTDHVLPVPVHRLADTEDYLAVLDGYPQVFPPGERFACCNGGYVVLALVAEGVAGRPFRDLVLERVCRPAGMHDTATCPSGAAATAAW
jgi:CubicO group peptidase (beta-lactamase class C family)